MQNIVNLELEGCISEVDRLSLLKNDVISITVYLPLYSFGSSQSYTDLCSDLIDAAYFAERFASTSKEAAAKFDYVSQNCRTRIELKLLCIAQDILPTLKDALLVYHRFWEGEFTPTQEDRYIDIREEIDTFEDAIPDAQIHFPEIIDKYLVNLVNGAYDQSENPEYVRSQMMVHRERLFSYYKSAYSSQLGGDAYASPNNWIIPSAIPLTRFFKVCSHDINVEDFNEAKFLTINGAALILTEAHISRFPVDILYTSRVCAQAIEDSEKPVSFSNWSAGARYYVHKKGEVAYVSDGLYIHLFFDLQPLDPVQTLRVYDGSSQLLKEMSKIIGLAENIKLDWHSLDDDQFEELCYDIILLNKKFDSSSIKKMGKSRSRDGGRDIVVNTHPDSSGGTRKWIFQCKLVTNGTSLTATKVQDISDIMEQYDAKGYGVMTSAVIDATLYDKVEKICQNRLAEDKNYSVYELERLLHEHKEIRRRYFKN